MDLSQAQVETYQREGFLVIERAFCVPEATVLQAALPEITDPSRGQVGFDEVSGMVRLSHGPHLYNETVRRLSLHPRLVQPAQRLLETEFHVYQSRLTIKPAAMGAVPPSGWVWHQDFSTWHRSDGMPEPRALVTFIFLDDVTAANAPLLVIPRSHRRGLMDTMADRAVDLNEGYQNVEVKPEFVREMAQRGGVTALTGPVGTVVFMHCALLHASAENISPLRRALLTVVFNPVDNRVQHPRKEHFAAANVVPVRPLTEDCLLTMAR
jgi:L-proline 4-hydroxylase